MFENCAPFTKCIIKIDGTTIDGGEDLGLFRLMCNLLEYNSNYFDATGNLWFYEASSFNDGIRNTDDFKSVKCDAKLFESSKASGANKTLRNPTKVVSLKHLSNFWRTLEMPLINYKV